jgi:hypothetical membrane protein
MPRWHIKPDPLGYPRHGLVVYLLALCVLSGVTLLFGRPAAGSLEAALDRQIVVGWALLLTLGAVFALVGIFWPGDVRTGLVTKRLGYAGLTFAATIYALVIIGTFRGEAMLIGGILLGFAYACFHTWRRINQRINEILEQSS